MPGIQLYICSAQPIIKHIGDLVAIRHAMQYNELLEDYCHKYDDCKVIQFHKWNGWYEGNENVGDGSFETFEQWLAAYSKLRQDIYVEDRVHYNQDGYDLSAEFFREQLSDIL